MGFTSDLPTYERFSTLGPGRSISGISFEPEPSYRFNRKLTVRTTSLGTLALAYSPELYHRRWRHEFFHGFFFHALHKNGIILNNESMLAHLAEGLIQAMLVKSDRLKGRSVGRKEIEESLDSYGVDFLSLSNFFQEAYPNRKKLEQTIGKMLESPAMMKSIRWLNKRGFYQRNTEESLTRWHYFKIIDYLLRNAPQPS